MYSHKVTLFAVAFIYKYMCVRKYNHMFRDSPNSDHKF